MFYLNEIKQDIMDSVTVTTGDNNACHRSSFNVQSHLDRFCINYLILTAQRIRLIVVIVSKIYYF